jgi:serine/threonine-protein kinase
VELIAGRYEILGLVGSGGMGTVYRARDKELDEIVALKVLRRELVEAPGMLARFRQEAKLARRVTHPNVARTYDIGEHEGEKFLTMEFVDGTSLGAVLAEQGKLPLGRAVEIGSAICAALAAAHAAGVLHRDLKPDNVLLAKDGRVVINDFGIARAFGQGAPHTLGHPIGTPAYMAPEQVEGRADLDARADVYALGAVLYEMLAGEPAWRGDNVFAIAAARLTRPPPDPRGTPGGRDVPDAAARVVAKCMARDRDARYARVEEVASALAGLTLPAPLASVPPLSAPAIVKAPSAEGKTIAVMPLKNLGPPEDAYLAEGFTEDVVDLLSMTPGLRVRAHRRAGDPREIGRELGVQVVVEGSLLKDADQLQIRMRLLGVEDGFQLWAQRFVRPASELLQVGDEAARAVAEALTLEHAPAASAPLDPVTVELYLRARQLYARGPEVAAAIPLYEQALERAPQHPLILSGYALALMRWVGFNDLDPSELERARKMAERAVAAAPRLPAARMALARGHFDAGDATAAARQLVATAPYASHDPELNVLWGRLVVECGALEAGIDRLWMALHADPAMHFARVDMARAYELLGEHDKADALLAVGFGLPAAERRGYWLPKTRILLWRGDRAGAQQLLADLRANGGPPAQWTPATDYLSWFLTAVAGEMTLDELISTALAYGPSRSHRMKRRAAFAAQMYAELASATGRDEMCLEQVERADREALLDLGWLDRCPLLTRFHEHPRFVAARANVEKRAREVLAVLGA